jgi:SPP1 family phage portal protein
MLQEEFLYWYTRGVQPILNRHKDTREDILNIVQVNTAAEIVDFKNGYLLTQPAMYTARRKGVQTKLKKLNEYLYRSGKSDTDNEIADWFHRVGKGVLFVEPNDDPEVPFKTYALDPRSAFVVYSLKPGNRPLMGVNFVTTEDGRAMFDVFTEKMVYHLSGGFKGKMMTPEKGQDFLATATTVESSEPNVLGRIPIIEYRYNSVNTACFELAIPLIDELSNLASNACDGIEQFIQTLAIAVNCEFPENTTVTDIRKAGMIALRSIGENKAEFKVLTEQLDQSQTKVLMDSLRDEVFCICAMPNRSDGHNYDTTGAAQLASLGWYQADCSRRNTEDLFRKSNAQFDRIILEILQRKGLLDINYNDFELNFVNNETVNVQAKAQAFQTLMAAGLHPELAAAKSGISNDPVKDMKMSEQYIKMIWGDPTKADEAEQTDGGKGEADIVEVDNNSGNDDTGGAV